MLGYIHLRSGSHNRRCNIARFVQVSFVTFVKPFYDWIPVSALKFIELVIFLPSISISTNNTQDKANLRQYLPKSEIKRCPLEQNAAYNSPCLLWLVGSDCQLLYCRGQSMNEKINFSYQSESYDKTYSYQVHC